MKYFNDKTFSSADAGDLTERNKDEVKDFIENKMGRRNAEIWFLFSGFHIK